MPLIQWVGAVADLDSATRGVSTVEVARGRIRWRMSLEGNLHAVMDGQRARREGVHGVYERSSFSLFESSLAVDLSQWLLRRFWLVLLSFSLPLLALPFSSPYDLLLSRADGLLADNNQQTSKG